MEPRLEDHPLVVCTLVGCGNMGAAIAQGIVKGGRRVLLRLSDTDECALQNLEKHLQNTTDDGAARVLVEVVRDKVVRDMVEGDDGAATNRVFIFAVKPYQLQDALATWRPSMRDGDIVVSVAAGVTLEHLKIMVEGGEKDAGKPLGVVLVRSMPNLPASVGAGVTALYSRQQVPETVKDLFSTCGTVVELAKETDFHAFTALAGSMPAFIFVALEALADAAVELGMTRRMAREVAVETVLGAAKFAALTKEHTAELKDRVASPGGTTIAGLNTLEKHGFRYALIDAIRETAKKSESLS